MLITSYANYFKGHNCQKPTQKKLIITPDSTNNLPLISFKGAQAIKAMNLAFISFKGETAIGETTLKTLGSKFDRFNEVIKGELYRGSCPTLEGLEELSKSGIKTIIDLRDEYQKGDYSEKVDQYDGITRIAFPCSTLELLNKSRSEQFLKIVSEAKQPIFIHCQEGRNRTDRYVALYCLKHKGMNEEDVEKLLYDPDTAFLLNLFIKREFKN